MKIYFKTGEFARIFGISKQTLIYYDNIGLLSPLHTDSDTNYRYYDASQIEDVDTILMLKEIGVPLCEIKEYLKDRNADTALRVLKEKKLILEEKIKHEIKILNRLKGKIEILDHKVDDSLLDKVVYKMQDEMYLYMTNIKEPYGIIEMEMSIRDLVDNITLKNLHYNYQIGVVVPYKNMINKNYIIGTKIFTIMDEYYPDENMYIKPQGLYASIYHKGAYRDVAVAYERLLSQLKLDGYKIVGDSFEEGIIDNIVANENDYLTLISVMISKE